MGMSPSPQTGLLAGAKRTTSNMQVEGHGNRSWNVYRHRPSLLSSAVVKIMTKNNLGRKEFIST